MDGRWVFIEWDAEWGMGLTPDGWQADSIRVLLGKRAPLRDLFAALIKNGEYRAYFRSEVDRYLEGDLSPENVRRHVDREAEAVRPVIPSELRTNAAGFTPEIWEANVETLRRFADNRGKVFRRLVARALEE